MDLTKYVEEHLFSFDNVYGEEVSNQEVSYFDPSCIFQQSSHLLQLHLREGKLRVLHMARQAQGKHIQ